MKLTVGITEWLPHWEMVLCQIGVSTEIVKSVEEIAPNLFATIIVTQKGDQREKDALLHYITEGGAIIIEADTAKWLLGIKTLPAFIKNVEPMDDSIFKGILPGFIDASLILPDKATHLDDNAGKKLVKKINYGNGYVIILPGSLTKSVLDTKVRRRNFPTPGPLLPSERVSRRSKQTIREIIQRSLEYLHMMRELPFVSLWFFPDGASTLFNLRIDTDFGAQTQVESLYDLCQKYEIPATWFIETFSSKNWIENYKKMKNQEIGLHCFRHHVFPDFKRNEKDIKSGKNTLSRVKIHPAGYAAPFGLWNVSLAKAIEHHGFVYSSEFCLDYDNLPFYPYLGNRFSSVLQIPVHPITTSCLRNAHHSKEDQKKYFKNLFKLKMEHHLPLFVYDHPSNANLSVLNWLLKTIRKQDIPIIPLVEYANWWTNRAAMKWFVKWDRGIVNIDVPSVDSSVWLLIKKSITEWTVVEMKQSIDLNKVEWKKSRLRKKFKTPMSERHTLNRKMVINDILHTYWKHRY